MRHGIKNVLWVHEVPSTGELATKLPDRGSPPPSVVRSRVSNVVEEAQRSRTS